MKRLLLLTGIWLPTFTSVFSQNIIDTIYFDAGGIDSYTNNQAPSTNFGTDTCLRVFYDYGSPTSVTYTYLKADFSGIPSNAVVFDADIYLYALAVDNTGDHLSYLQRLTSSWDEDTITYSAAPSATGVNQVRFSDDSSSVLGWQFYDMTAIAKYQVSNPSQNYGFRILQSAQSGTLDKGMIYASKDHSNSALRPYIVLEYYVPESDTIYFESYADARVRGDSTGTNYGGDSLLMVNWTYDTIGRANRTFLYADLSHIPRDYTITIADLNMYALSVDNTAAHAMYIEYVNSGSWYEDTITWSNQPTISATYRSSVSSISTSEEGWHKISTVGIAKYAVWLPEKNYGWRMSLQSESGTDNKGVVYASAEHDSTDIRPYLFIEYVPPIEIEGYVTHCTNGNDDGAIEIASITGGCKSYVSYIWYILSGGVFTQIELGTDLTKVDVSDLEDGLYMLLITDYHGATGYKYFFVGEEGATTDVNFGITNSTNRAKYTEDSELLYNKTTSDSSFLGGTLSTVGTYTSSLYNYRGLLQYKVDWDPSLEFTRGDHAFIGNTGCYQTTTSDNDAWISRVTEPWGESYVTWGTRPAVTTQDRIYIPTTTTNGVEVRNDTIDILPFIPYWQEHPDENYGYDFALNSFSQANTAYRYYYSSDLSGHTLYVSYTVKPPIETIYYDSLGLGNIMVNAPAGELPYTYLIGYDTLPSIAELWDDVKDSVAVDSLTFFRGKVNSHRLTFSNLAPEHYFVAVYDNNGDKIFEQEVLLTEETSLLSSITLDDDTLKVASGENSGSGRLDVLVRKDQGGTFEFTLEEIGDILVGFNYESDLAARFTEDFEYSVEIDSTNLHFMVMKSDSIIYEDTVIVNDVFRIAMENYDFVVYQNKYEMSRFRMPDAPEEDYLVNIVFKASAGLLAKPVKIGKAKLPKPVKTVTTNTECGLNNGSIKMTFNTLTFPSVTGGSYVIKDVSDGSTVESGTLTFPGTTIEYLPVGDYKVIYTTTGTPATSWTEYFTIGLPVLWDLVDAYYTPTLTGIASNSALYSAHAVSSNILQQEVNEGFVVFNQGPHHVSPPLGGGFLPAGCLSEVGFIESNGDQVMKVRIFSFGAAILPVYVTALDDTNTPLNTPFLAYSNGPFKIALHNDTLKAYYDNSAIPFAYMEQGTPDDYRVSANSLKGYVKDAFVDFCYGSTTSELCAELDYELNGNYYVTNNGYFCFVYNQEYNDTTLTFNIYRISNSLAATQDDFALENMNFGENRVVLDLTPQGFCLGKGFYVLEVINGKGEHFYLRFYNGYNGCIPSDEGAPQVFTIAP